VRNWPVNRENAWSPAGASAAVVRAALSRFVQVRRALQNLANGCDGKPGNFPPVPSSQANFSSAKIAVERGLPYMLPYKLVKG